ncbi:MAG TPA: hypothetical protein VK531_11625 [Gemmatimonadales bacterium]|nr:hypothetical protein [Gemmatimonadales bacterium]
MPRTRPPLSLPSLLACLTVACSARAPSDSRVRADRNVLTQEDLGEHHFATAYEAVASLRPSWLETRGTDSFTTPSQVLVYLDDSRLGGVETLRTIGLANVLYIRHIDGIAASARWGLDHGQGVIQVATRS